MALSEYGAKAKREYQRKWRAKNRNKAIANNERYWERKGEELRLKELAEEERGGKNEK